MALRRHQIGVSSMAVSPDRPLVGVILTEDGQEVVRYFADDAEADAAIAQEAVQDARTLAGAWADLDWEEALEEFDRIRHDNEPTPPIEAL